MPRISLEGLPHTLKVLIVEDHSETQLLFKKQLPETWTIDVAPTAAAARQRADRQIYDVALIDIRLEAPTAGVELFETLDESDYWAHTKAIAVTAYALPNDRPRFLKIGFDNYLGKPFTKAEILEVIAETLA